MRWKGWQLWGIEWGERDVKKERVRAVLFVVVDDDDGLIPSNVHRCCSSHTILTLPIHWIELLYYKICWIDAYAISALSIMNNDCLFYRHQYHIWMEILFPPSHHIHILCIESLCIDRVQPNIPYNMENCVQNRAIETSITLLIPIEFTYYYIFS